MLNRNGSTVANSSGRIDLSGSAPQFNQDTFQLTNGWIGTRVHSNVLDLVAATNTQRHDGLTTTGNTQNRIVTMGGSTTVGGELFLGAENNSAGSWSECAIAAVLVYEGAHSDTTRRRIERWLGQVYGVAVA